MGSHGQEQLAEADLEVRFRAGQRVGPDLDGLVLGSLVGLPAPAEADGLRGLPHLKRSSGTHPVSLTQAAPSNAAPT